MNEVTLVSGSETLTGRKLIEKLLARGSQIIAPVAGTATQANETSKANLCVLTWNRSSWFSTKAVVREALRRYGRIDSGWILHQAPPPLRNFSEARSNDIEAVLEQSIKGNIALVRELLPLLEASGGFLGMVLPHQSGTVPGPLDSLAHGAFTGFSTSLIQEVKLDLWACAFISRSTNADDFATKIIELGTSKPVKLKGRWYKYAEGRRLFGGSTILDAPD